MHQMNNINKYDDITSERRMLTVRITACFLFLILANLTDFFARADYYNVVVLFYLTYNLGLWAYASNKVDSRMFVASIFVDILIISVLIGLRGGIYSDLYCTYFVVLAYILSKRQKHLIISATLFISLLYAAVCLLYSDFNVNSYYIVVSRLLIRICIMLMTVFILFNIKSKMNYSSMLSQKAYEMALIDPLTKVYNRNMLETINAYRKSHPYIISFAMIDIDDFKAINDSFGHQKGDKILSMLGELIKKNIRADDICIRYGGEEFLLAFKNTDNETAFKILERIKSAFCEYTFYYDGIPMSCTISAGLALGTEDQDNDLIISYADMALYQAKRSGKNNIMTYCSAS